MRVPVALDVAKVAARRSGGVRRALRVMQVFRQAFNPAGRPAVSPVGEGWVALEGRQRHDLEVGLRQRSLDVDAEDRGARLAAQVADDRDVEAVSAQQDAEPQVQVGLGVQRPAALEAEGVTIDLIAIWFLLRVSNRIADVSDFLLCPERSSTSKYNYVLYNIPLPSLRKTHRGLRNQARRLPRALSEELCFRVTWRFDSCRYRPCDRKSLLSSILATPRGSGSLILGGRASKENKDRT